ncbi:hypothetical protein Taro_032289, partial [Colocasia esculenta]|nr:hypothetical protein [Colocasia esculenta]
VEVGRVEQSTCSSLSSSSPKSKLGPDVVSLSPSLKARYHQLYAGNGHQVHTPDSSRYWIADSYEDRFHNGHEPENVDKVLPEAPKDLVCELAWRYIFLFETITKSKFEINLSEEPVHDRISRNVAQAISSL